MYKKKAHLGKKRIKILFIHHATGWGGATINLINIINNLDKNLFDIKVLLIKASVVAEKLKENNISYEIAKSTFYSRYYQYFTHSEAGYIKWYQAFEYLRLSISWLLSRYFFAQRELVKHDYDIAHLNSSVLTDWIAPAKIKGKVIIHIQEPFRKGKFDFLRPVFRSQMRKFADHIIAISEDNAKRINIPEKTSVIYNFIQINSRFTESEINTNNGKVLYLGGYEIIKGFFTLVDSLDYLNDGVKIIFCGNYQIVSRTNTIQKLFAWLKNLLPVHRKIQKSLKIIRNHPKAVFIGQINSSSEMIRKTEFLISPFSYPHFSRPVFEAFANKKCVIGTDVEGMDEIIDHNINGLIIRKNNPKLLAEAINYLHANPQLREQYANNGYTKAVQLFSNDNIAKIESVYAKLIS